MTTHPGESHDVAPHGPPPPAGGERRSRGRRYAVRALLILATILTVLSIFTVWANRQLLNADNWADTSEQLLQNEDIRTQVSTFLVDQVYANVNVPAQLSQSLPPRLQPLAGPAANALRQGATRTTEIALQRPRVEQAWKTANRVTAQQFIAIAKGESNAVTSSGNAVILDLRVVLLDIVQRLGLPGKLVAKIPPDAGRIKIMSSDQVGLVRNGAAALEGLSIVLPVLAFLCLASAVWLSDRRRRTLLVAGLDLIGAGLLVLILRRWLGGYVTDQLVPADSVRPAADAAWSIGTRILQDVGQAVVIAGIPVVLAAWLAGPSRAATAVRRAIAPWMRERPDLVYAVVGVVVLAVIAWGPIPATRKVIPVLVMIALVILGVEALRRQIDREFPDATVEGRRGGGHGGLGRARDAISGARRGHDGAEGSPDQQLERLAALHDRGDLSDDEFAAAKRGLLSG